MKIKEINIIQFGKFKDAVFALGGGFNIVKGDNESGKSTLLAFIKFALYGVGRKNPNITVGERERAISWNAGIAAGSLTIEDVDGRCYRIERAGREGARGTYSDRARIIDTESGEEVFAGEVPGEHFLGINAQAYDSMCNIKQLETVMLNGDAVKGVIDNLLSSGDENTSVQAALKVLDTERRRLLHTNGKGGLVFDGEIALERLKSEHRGAVVFENECAKNRDELDRVELALDKAKKEFEVAQRMCDVHDDALRLQKFDRLRELKLEQEALGRAMGELDSGVAFKAELASYERIAEIKSVCESLERSRASHESAQRELAAAEQELSGITYQNGEGLDRIIDEFGSPRSAAAFIGAKRKKVSSTSFMFTAFGIGGGILLAFAALLAFVMNNAAGATTVAFIGAVLCAVAAVSYRQFASARAEIADFFGSLGKEFASADEESILSHLEAFTESKAAKAQRANAFEGAKFRMSVACDALSADSQKACSILSELGLSCADGEETEYMSRVAEQMKDYLMRKSELEAGMRQNAALIRSLSGELARFSESDIRAKITPEILEKIKSTSFEKLKTERDLALHRTNQYGQYKAGIERNLASSGARRASNEIYPEIEAQESYVDSLKLRLDAVKLAAETIGAASASLKSDITPRIRDRARENLSMMTGGKYSELYIDENMGLSVFADGATRPIDSLSRGSLDVAYFAVRLALLEALMADKNPPLYMDECLSQLDDGRARGVLCAIAEHSRQAQSILFTCQSRDVELAKSMTDVNIIEI